MMTHIMSLLCVMIITVRLATGAIQDQETILVSWSPTENILAVAHKGEMWLYSATLEPITQLKIETEDMGQLGVPVWSSDGVYVATSIAKSQLSNPVYIWNIKSGEYTVIPHHQNATASITWSPDNKLASTYENSIYIWDIETGDALTYFNVSDKPMYFPLIQWSPDNKFLALGDSNKLTLWNTNSFIAEKTYEFSDTIRGLCWRPDSQQIGIVNRHHGYILNVDNLEQVVLLTDHQQPITNISCGRDYVTTAGLDDEIFIWNMATGEKTDTISINGQVHSTSWHSDGTQLVFTDQSNKIHIYTVNNH